MNKVSFLCASIFFTLSSPVLSATPSFDCARASNFIENTICENDNLSNLDSEMSLLYGKIKQTNQDSDSLRSRQIEWLRIRNKCNDADCIKSAYLSRLRDLNNDQGMKSPSESSGGHLGILGDRKIKFKLTYGDSYPICEPFVDMLNASNYSEYPSCGRHILPKFSQFKSIDWTEVNDKSSKIKIVTSMKERELIFMKYLVKTSLDDYLKEDLRLIDEGKLQLFEFLLDVDGDKIKDHIYKSVKKINLPMSSDLCDTLNYFYLDASSITSEKAKTLNKSPFFLFNLNGNNELFLYGDKILSSNWSVGADKKSPNLDLYWNQKVCGISVN